MGGSGGGGMRGKGEVMPHKICDSVFIQLSPSIGKNGKLLINLQFTPL